MPDANAFVDAGLAALEQALHDRGSDLRNVQLATLSPEGRPGLRTLVLRRFERLPARAELQSDARAAKVREIAYSGRVAILAWSAADRLQLRLDGFARLHRSDDLARARWEDLSPNARRAYGLASHPGQPVVAPGEAGHLPPDQQFEQFAVISVALTTVDVLRLEADGGQTRAQARFTQEGLEASWQAP